MPGGRVTRAPAPDFRSGCRRHSRSSGGGRSWRCSSAASATWWRAAGGRDGAGDAGVGKSRLLKESASARRGRLPGIHGRCAEDLPLPYRPFVEALEAPSPRHAGVGGPRRTSDSSSGAAGRRPRGARHASAPEQLRLFRAVARGCLTLAQRRPTMLVLEDLHWADRSTLDLLSTSSSRSPRRPRAQPARCLSVVRIGRPRSAGVWSHIARLRREEIAVSPRDRGVSRKGDRSPDPGSGSRSRPTNVASVSATTRGNPLFVQELFHDWSSAAPFAVAADISPQSATSSRSLARGTDSVIAARIRPLGARCLEVLRLASLLGCRFSLQTLAAVSDSERGRAARLRRHAAAPLGKRRPGVRVPASAGPPRARERAERHPGPRMHRRIAETLQRLAPAAATTNCSRSRTT